MRDGAFLTSSGLLHLEEPPACYAVLLKTSFAMQVNIKQIEMLTHKVNERVSSTKNLFHKAKSCDS